MLKNTILFILGAIGFCLACNEGQWFPGINLVGMIIFWAALRLAE